MHNIIFSNYDCNNALKLTPKYHTWLFVLLEPRCKSSTFDFVVELERFLSPMFSKY